MSTNSAIQITKDGIDTIDRALGLFNKVLDRVVPWNTYEETAKELERYSKDYSEESAQLVSEIKSLMNNAQDSYYGATQCIYVWCGSAKLLLESYLELSKIPHLPKVTLLFEKQKAIFVQLLDEGLTKMRTGQDKLKQSCESFNNLAGKLATLQRQFISEFASDSSFYLGKMEQIKKDAIAQESVPYGGVFGVFITYTIVASLCKHQMIPELKEKLAEIQSFFDRLKELVDNTNVNIVNMKNKLQGEIQKIETLKGQNDASADLASNDVAELYKAVLESATGLMAQCDEYQRSHGKKN